MHLAYESSELRTLCEAEGCAERQWGSDVARRLFNRIADIHTATSVSDLIAGFPKFIGQGADQRLIVQLYGGLCLFLVPLPIPPPLSQSGLVNWKRVSRLKLQKIEVCHD